MTDRQDIVVNGKVYPMWQQFVQKKEEWIGGTVRDTSGGLHVDTEITDIELTPNGPDSACFTVVGKDFTCAGDVRHLGIASPDLIGDKTFLCLHGFGGHVWGIKRKGE